jgi:hypothetical protein
MATGGSDQPALVRDPHNSAGDRMIDGQEAIMGIMSIMSIMSIIAITSGIGLAFGCY